MKKLLLIISLGIACLTFGQKTTFSEGIVFSRVITDLPINVTVNELPNVLLQAYADGNIRGYFPLDDSKVTYAQFLYHFGYPEQAVNTFANACNVTAVPDQLLSCLSLEFDVHEEVHFDPGSSNYKRDIKYIQLVYSGRCVDNVRGVDLRAVRFKMSDIEKLSSQYQLQTSGNDQQAYAVADALKLKLYSGEVLRANHKWVREMEGKAHFNYVEEAINAEGELYSK